jgi:hypothetical protein
MFNTRKELLNVLGMVSMSLVFLDPDGAITTEDQADHNNLYVGFTYSQSQAAITDSFAGKMMIFYDEEDD